MYKGGLISTCHRYHTLINESGVFCLTKNENSTPHKVKDCILITDWNIMIYKTDG